MDNSKKTIHSSGPLSMLMQSGKITKVEGNQSSQEIFKNLTTVLKSEGSYFKTESGVEFSEQELVYLNPKECESWKYANRQKDELGDIDELVGSIRANKQLQPALVRLHPTPHDGIKYEVIFGRRRHIACLRLGVPFLAILKSITNVQDAIAAQDAENKLRNDVSNYSNALLYKRLLSDGVFKMEKELAGKLRLSASTLNDLMAYSKIPEDIIRRIPNIHELSKQIVIKLVQLINRSPDNHKKILAVAGELGASITSPSKLERICEDKTSSPAKDKIEKLITAKTYSMDSGKKLFTLKSDNRGLPSFVLDKAVSKVVDLEEICQHLSQLLEKALTQSGYPDY